MSLPKVVFTGLLSYVGVTIPPEVFSYAISRVDILLPHAIDFYPFLNLEVIVFKSVLAFLEGTSLFTKGNQLRM